MVRTKSAPVRPRYFLNSISVVPTHAGILYPDRLKRFTGTCVRGEVFHQHSAGRGFPRVLPGLLKL